MTEARKYSVLTSETFGFTIEADDGSTVDVSIPEPSVEKYLRLHEKTITLHNLIGAMESDDPDLNDALVRAEKNIHAEFLDIVPEDCREAVAAIPNSVKNEIISDFYLWQMELVGQAVKKNLDRIEKSIRTGAWKSLEQQFTRLSEVLQKLSSCAPAGVLKSLGECLQVSWPELQKLVQSTDEKQKPEPE